MITLEITDNIAEVTLNAPEKMNALDETAIKDLGQAYTDAADAGVRALLLRGEGRGFSAGRDISNVDPAVDDAYEYLSNLVTPVLRQMAEFPAPTFAAVQGACLGVGLGLAIATDVVYVAENAKIGSPFANLGATLDSGGHALFTERLGAHRTLDLIYTADLMSGKEAVEQGLFSRWLPVEQLLDFTVKSCQGRPGATGALPGLARALVAQTVTIASPGIGRARKHCPGQPVLERRLRRRIAAFQENANQISPAFSSKVPND